METSIEKQLKAEIAHIFDSGANELRVFEMVKNFIDNRSLVKRYSNKINIARFPEDIYFKQDGDGHWYWIKESEVEIFDKMCDEIAGIDYMDNPDAFDNFTKEYGECRTLGDKNNAPAMYAYFL